MIREHRGKLKSLQIFSKENDFRVSNQSKLSSQHETKRGIKNRQEFKNSVIEAPQKSYVTEYFSSPGSIILSSRYGKLIK